MSSTKIKSETTYKKLRNESNYTPVGRNFNAVHLSKFLNKFEEKGFIS
jgi:hypothetical protein